MFYRKSENDYAPICNFVPGYAFYSGIGYGLAENLLELVEWLLGLRK